MFWEFLQKNSSVFEEPWDSSGLFVSEQLSRQVLSPDMQGKDVHDFYDFDEQSGDLAIFFGEWWGPAKKNLAA